MRESPDGTRAAAWAGLALLCPLACLLACERQADVTTTSALRAGPGQTLYLTYCQSCHGPGGKGDGPVADQLRTPPTDLTRLWMRYGTPLDREPIAAYIDGRWLMFFHGPREMPIWGEEIFGDAPQDTPGLEHLRQHLIETLIQHLETLQSEQQA